MWLYKKAKNLTKEEKQRLVKNSHKYCYRTFVMNISREDFIKNELERYIEELELLDKESMPHDDWQYEFAKEYTNPEKLAEWYVHIIFDTYFRCYSYGDEEIDNYETMINYLEPLAPTMIKQYGTFDENGKFHYYNPETYEGKNGLTDELKEMLKFLYKDNDIFVEFS